MTDDGRMPEDCRMAPNDCPGCGAVLDAATETTRDKRRPKPGDLTVCIYCTAVLCWGDGMRLRASTLAERSEAGPELERAVAAVQTMLLTGKVPQRGRKP